MSTLPKIAIITRTKNRPFFLERCIQSVQAQTYKDYIHVILNDGGDKKAVEAILQKYPDAHRKVVHNSKSVGLVKALNQAIKAVDSEYITILDDDDAWHQDRLKLSMETTEQYSAVASIVPMETVTEDVASNGEIIEIKRTPHSESWTGEVSLYKQAHRNYLSNGAIMYSRKVYDELNGYDESLKTAEDWDFGIRLMLRYNVEQTISDIALVYYHQRPDVRDGGIGNSVHANVREQERSIMVLRNNYLRDDLNAGKFGIGFIMNDVEQNLNNIVRLEGHINRAASDVNEKVESMLESRIGEKIKRVLKIRP
ncbi:MAG: glycosyltransferase [Rickettsia endosymbiont of Ixodes persulcatus]|nr:glycosyltransferase [Rickettsia endosymbiont of Ixodes persulcatus]